MTSKETAILEYLLIHRGRIIKLEELMLQISHLDVNTLANQIQIHSTGDEIEQVLSAIGSLVARVNDAYLMQKNFSSNAAHELRTPLTVIQNKIEVLRLKKECSYLEYEELLDVLYKNTGWLSSLVIELLAYQSGVHFLD